MIPYWLLQPLLVVAKPVEVIVNRVQMHES